MKLHLVDIEPKVAEALEMAFKGLDVDVQCGDILKVSKNTIVSPANSYGFMDGGIDRLYTEHFGLQPQTELQEAIKRREEGYLPVGASILVRTGDSRVPFMIAAPTMITPGAIPPSNCFYAMTAVLQAADRNKNHVTDVYCPGLGTFTGRLEPNIAAEEMASAFKKWSMIKDNNS